VVVVSVLAGWTESVGAATVSTTGAAEIVPAPASAAVRATESSTNVRVFDERSITLTASLTVSFFNQNGALVPLTLTAGTCLQSHMVHFDEAVGQPAVLTGSATFDMPIVALIPTNVSILGLPRLLDITDPVFGVVGTTYPAPGDGGRGIEAFRGDGLSYSAAQPNRLGFTLNTDGFDQMRVLTQCSPEPVIPEVPLAAALPLTGAAVLGGWMLLNDRRAATA
jgi:hypothetical protein